MSVWISDEKLLIFASLISPSKKILFEKKYQTFDTVFHHQMKHCISCLIYYIQNREKFCSLNPESWALESWNTAQGIRNLTNDWNPESEFHWQRLESSTWNPNLRVWSPESKTELDSLIWNYFSFAFMNLRHNNTFIWSMTKRWKYRIKTFMFFGVERDDLFIFTFRAG